MVGGFASRRYVYKLRASRIRRAGWEVSLSPSEARGNGELIALSESQLMRLIDGLNGVRADPARVAAVRGRIRELRLLEDEAYAAPGLAALYSEMDGMLFRGDYVCVVADSVRDYRRLAARGFRLNGREYGRLLGTPSGVKRGTVVFASAALLPELRRLLDNGRDLSKRLVPAKLEAYYALACSASVPVSMPRGVAVVRDCVTRFRADEIVLDDTGGGQPRMRLERGREVELDDSDGYGMAMPSLMERWGREIGAGYLLPGCVIRNSFCKGAVFPVDFREFAAEHGVSEFKDVWGDTRRVEDTELVLTESMLKLWDSYPSMEAYLSCCERNGYSFAITKASPETLEDVREMNYQFLQSYDFTDAQIGGLVAPTVSWIRGVLSGDWRMAVLFARGTRMGERGAFLDGSFSSAVMAEPRMMGDPFVRGQIGAMLRKRIDAAKTGVLDVPGNYSLVSGDPYSLCQSMFGLEVTGLLGPGQVYSRYWADRGVARIASYRAPMTCHNNIRVLEVASGGELDRFYRYMTTPTVFNSWDTCADAMNGFDKDGDCVINTPLPLLVGSTAPLPAIVCVQRKAPMRIPTERDLAESNVMSFGNAVGKVTNRITSMYEVRARFPEGSRERRVLDYRIMCGQLYQQNEIDKTKGIEARDMPASWHSRAAAMAGRPRDRALDLRILVDRKPYFMQYVYPSERAKWREYVDNGRAKCLMQFRRPLRDLLAAKGRTPEEESFADRFLAGLPLGVAPCTVNRICWEVERELDGEELAPAGAFDHSLMASGAGYTPDQLEAVAAAYADYRLEHDSYAQRAREENADEWERRAHAYMTREAFRRRCEAACPDGDALCDAILDLCYARGHASKQFAWDMCGETFVRNLLRRNGGRIRYPVRDDGGDIEFRGMRFSVAEGVVDPEAFCGWPGGIGDGEEGWGDPFGENGDLE